ncbi:MAG: hypothetical protein QM405_06120 [Euryarchaeota archaeon]|nr:hypothetical protein [Euryarchaeota archaeon]
MLSISVAMLDFSWIPEIDSAQTLISYSREVLEGTGFISSFLRNLLTFPIRWFYGYHHCHDVKGGS